ncbi:hypothetical protein HDK77DRAFT_512206 [Phyllosticta capitalensis]|uniref:SPRY domain-containing protein n=1 Tax=Phyllosticta capitalensis TaxID=121624 RepID=A0ABR1YG56_9PEZI
MRSFFKKLHHHGEDGDGNEQNRPHVPSGPPPDYNYSDAKLSSSSKHAQQEQYHAPYEPSSSSSTYAPPPGPPPNWPGASASGASASSPPPYHDWTVVPDNALLPPPPPITYKTSPTANASAQDGEAAYKWCLQHPLASPLFLTPPQLAALRDGAVAFAPPPHCFAGELVPRMGDRPGRYGGRTHSAARDAALLTALPLYAARAHNPVVTGSPAPTIVYFEVGVLGLGGMASSPQTSTNKSFEEGGAGLAIGYVAPPYPAWRLPGWQRGSLGVHGDDGRRYVNDTFGGADFTTAWRAGERVGLGLVLKAPPAAAAPPAYQGAGGGQGAAAVPPTCDVQVFFTRNGVKEGGWDMAGELDENALGGKQGLEGECDLYGAVGVFGVVDFEVFFHRDDWLFRPEKHKW